MGKAHRVAITGYGAVCSLGQSVPEIWQSIREGRLGYRYTSLANRHIVTRFLGLLDAPPKLSQFPKSLRKFLPEFAQLGLAAVGEAVAMAFANEAIATHYDPFECGAIFGTGWGAVDRAGDFYPSYAQCGMASPFAALMGMHNVGTAAISMHWQLRGYQNTPVAACATSSIALGDAFELIRGGRLRMAVAGGAESLRSEFAIWSTDVLQALSKEQNVAEKASCPFSLDRSGFVMSEGAGAICLEELESARARGAAILGEIVGYGNCSDAFDITAPAPDLKARASCIAKACDQAEVDPAQIGYVNAHGTSTPLNDVNETECLKLALGPHAHRIPVSSTKSYTGHLMGAAGIMESIFCVKAIETGMIPATANLHRPDPKCDLDFVPNVHREIGDLDLALNVNYGFGGANSALLFRKHCP